MKTYFRYPGKRYNFGAQIPQHPLLTVNQWNRLRKREIKQFTYWATKGPYYTGDTTNYPHAFYVIITREDAP